MVHGQGSDNRILYLPYPTIATDTHCIRVFLLTQKDKQMEKYTWLQNNINSLPPNIS